MLAGAVDYLEQNVGEGSEWKKELSMIGVQHFLKTQVGIGRSLKYHKENNHFCFVKTPVY
jgi:hypothetical protein